MPSSHLVPQHHPTSDRRENQDAGLHAVLQVAYSVLRRRVRVLPTLDDTPDQVDGIQDACNSTSRHAERLHGTEPLHATHGSFAGLLSGLRKKGLVYSDCVVYDMYSIVRDRGLSAVWHTDGSVVAS